MFKANISPLVAEQYKRTKLFVITTKSGERVIVDPSLTTLRVYMVRSIFPRLTLFYALAHPCSCHMQYFYELINIGALVGQIGMTYSEKVSDSDQAIVFPLTLLQSSSAFGSRILSPPSYSCSVPLFYSSGVIGMSTPHPRARFWQLPFGCSATQRKANGASTQFAHTRTSTL